ncbi:MAG: DUF4097 family beta strand repeat-containing protein [Deltaproteobacteria bacterium]|nr:DUF4097 family beta strand repeat-containing protein [Deltaproteobacteria bacterium]
MNAHVEIELLEALARNESLSNRALVSAHLAQCAQCADELSWLRTEGLLFAKSTDETGTDALWDAVAQKISAPAQSDAPYRAPGVALVAPSKPAKGRSRFALVAVAAALVVTVGTVAAVRRGHETGGLTGASATAQAAVEGAITLRLRTTSADVRIVAGASRVVRVVVGDSDVVPTIVRTGVGRYDVLFAGGGLSAGRVRVEVPPESSVDVTTASGEVSLGALGGAAVVHTTSGDIEATSLSALTAESTSGDVTVRALTGGAAVVHTISGDVDLRHVGAATEVTVQSTSGALTWRGLCGRGCRLEAHTVSGDVRLGMARESAATVRFESTSGSFEDGLATAMVSDGPVRVRRIGPGQGGGGEGEGSVQVTTVSGALELLRGE